MLPYAAICILSLSACPVGVFLMLRRMSLTGDAMSHAILPGVGIASLFAGAGLIGTLLGGIVAGLIVGLLAGLASRITVLKEDSSLAVFYLVSLAAGILLLQAHGSDEDILHQLFGSIDAVGATQLYLVSGVATVTLFGLAIIWRPLIAECLDAEFLRSVVGRGAIATLSFLALAIINLVAGYQTMGALLSIGLMILPAVSARFWARDIDTMCLAAILIGSLCGLAGMALARRLSVDPGPAITLTAGGCAIASCLLAPLGLLRRSRRSHSHRVA